MVKIKERIVPKWMKKVPGLNWYKIQYSDDGVKRNGTWYNYESKKDLTITDGLTGIYHVMYGGETIKIIKLLKNTNKFVQRYMKSHPRG